MQSGQEPTHQWIERNNLPLRQQVALVHEATSMLYQKPLGSKDALWVNEPATDKQLTALKRRYPKRAMQIDSVQLTKGKASEAITARQLRRTLDNLPSTDE